MGAKSTAPRYAPFWKAPGSAEKEAVAGLPRCSPKSVEVSYLTRGLRYNWKKSGSPWRGTRTRKRKEEDAFLALYALASPWLRLLFLSEQPGRRLREFTGLAPPACNAGGGSLLFSFCSLA